MSCKGCLPGGKLSINDTDDTDDTDDTEETHVWLSVTFSCLGLVKLIPLSRKMLNLNNTYCTKSSFINVEIFISECPMAIM